MTRRLTRRLIDRFWSLVDSEDVGLFLYVFGVGFILAGAYGIVVADLQPPLTLKGPMSTMSVDIWYWLNILGPLVSLTGKSLRGNFIYTGMWLQLSGDITVTLALLAYVAGTVQVESWGKGAYGAFLGTAFCISAGLLVTRDLRRLRAVEKRLKQK
jgi:hypothetical protein